MNAQHWDFLLQTLTGDYGRQMTDYGVMPTHLRGTFDFLRNKGVDSEGKTLLDIGCGNTALIKDEVLAKWTGFDSVLPNTVGDYLVGDAHELPEQWSAAFDIVFCSHLLEHTIAPIVVLSEIRRVLKDDGDVIIGVPFDPGFLSEDHNYVLTIAGWKHLFKRAGFKMVAEIEFSNCLAVHLKKASV